MHCTHVKLPDGTRAIVCTSGARKEKRCICGAPAGYLCDWKIGSGKTCDAPICDIHAEPVAKDKHLCPAHSKAWAQWKAQRIQQVCR